MLEPRQAQTPQSFQPEFPSFSNLVKLHELEDEDDNKWEEEYIEVHDEVRNYLTYLPPYADA